MLNAYKISTDRTPAWRECTVGTLLISVGQPYHEGEKFASTVEWAARHFECLHVLIADTLQRHNGAGNDGEDGLGWYTRNKAALDDCGKPVTVSYWEEWRKKPEYPATEEQFRAAARPGSVLADALRHDAEAFVVRQLRSGAKGSIEQSTCYLIEELAVITLQARELPAPNARIYPGAELECFRVVARGLVEGAPHGLEGQYHTAINLKRRGQGYNYAPAPERLAGATL